MDNITDEQWAATYQKVFLRYHELKGHAILKGDLFDEMNNLRLMVNAYNAGNRTQNLYSKMKAAVE
jgi:hypothetical protein